jgi:hypothetical protein
MQGLRQCVQEFSPFIALTIIFSKQAIKILANYQNRIGMKAILSYDACRQEGRSSSHIAPMSIGLLPPLGPGKDAFVDQLEAFRRLNEEHIGARQKFRQ